MKIGLIDVDGHNFPNLALMRISAYHKAKGDEVEWWWSDFIHYDIVYMSKVFKVRCNECFLFVDRCCELEMWIENLPPAEPERQQGGKKGTWLEKNIVRMNDELDDSNVIDEWQSARCSRCGKYHTTPFKYSFDYYKFCPHCGKPMKGDEK